jgi:4'-phosphopantetheinyl transferase
LTDGVVQGDGVHLGGADQSNLARRMSVRLAPDVAQVWCLRPETLPPGGEALLDSAERAQLGRLAYARDRELYRAAHLLLRHALSAAGGLPPEAWRFVRPAQGKPRLAPGFAGPAFNLSHTPGLVACVLCAGGEVGIDAEHDRGGAAPLELAPRVLTPGEQAALQALPAAERAAAFFGLWTLKEATMKATGQGAALDPATLRAALDPPDVAGQPGLGWRFAAWRPTPRHHLAVALRGAPAGRSLAWCEVGSGRWDAAWQQVPLSGGT